MEVVWSAILAAGQEQPPAMQQDDAALMALYRRGDEQAFELLYRRHRAPLYRYITRLLPRRADGDEIFQEVWVAVVKGRERYRPDMRFAAFLFAVAHRRIVDHLRRKGRRPESEISSDIRDATADPEILMENTALGVALSDAIAALPVLQREVFLLRADGELTLEEIATVTGCSFETAKSRLKYANRTLREKLELWK